ncbi:MAG: hypothetical protein DRH17_09640 [Deltaproteobacteria bacterium]|nr:MAG: hypothetical protein DRH17_09640 [Deltaproteobacteria bacterium]
MKLPAASPVDPVFTWTFLSTLFRQNLSQKSFLNIKHFAKLKPKKFEHLQPRIRVVTNLLFLVLAVKGIDFIHEIFGTGKGLAWQGLDTGTLCVCPFLTGYCSNVRKPSGVSLLRPVNRHWGPLVLGHNVIPFDSPEHRI